MTCWICGFETTKLATAAESPTCKNGPCQICIAVANLDEEINQAAATLRRLLAKRCDLRSEQNRAHDLVHRLPAELKNHTFELLRPQSEWGALPPRHRPAPSYLTSICKSWRDMACSNPLLWSTIHISFAGQVPNLNFVQDCVLRSRTLPLTLHIDVYDREGIEGELKAVFDAISQCSNRLHSLSLYTDIPLKVLRTFYLSNFQCHLLKKLQIHAEDGTQHDISQPVPLPTLSLENIDLISVSPQLLQVSWNHLSSATISSTALEEISQLFHHASQMTYCHILSFHGPQQFLMPPIVHQRLKTLSLVNVDYYGVASRLLSSLTLPCLQEFRTNETALLRSTHLPALVRRSSCPLTSITINSDYDDECVLDDFHPLPGVEDLVLGAASERVSIQKLLLEEYFPDLRRLTLKIRPFIDLWDMGVIPLLLDRKRPQPDTPNEGRVCKLLVVHKNQPWFDVMRRPDVSERLKASNVVLGEDGVEF